MNFKRILLILFLFCFCGVLHPQFWRTMTKKEKPNFFEIQEAFYRRIEIQAFIETLTFTKINIETQRKLWKRFKRWEWFMAPRVNKQGDVDTNLIWKAVLTKKKRVEKMKKEAVAPTWRELGPTTVPDGIHQYFGGMGRIDCIAIDPKNPDIIWAGSPSGGLWKTTDSGEYWFANNNGLSFLAISWIVIDPRDSSTMYLATGDFDSSRLNSQGVLKSTDGGKSWQKAGLENDSSNYFNIRKILIHPFNSKTLFAATNGGIYKTTDGGGSWDIKQEGFFSDIEVNPSNPSIWYAADSIKGVYKSTDNGEKWGNLTNGLPVSGFIRCEIAISGESPNILYAVFSDDDESNQYGFLGLYRSIDGGIRWRLIANRPNILGWEADGSDNKGQGDYDLTIALHPLDPNTVFIGGVNFWVYRDKGTNWECLAHWAGDDGRLPFVHADHHALVFSPQKVLYVGTDGGIFKSTDYGKKWKNISNGLAVHQIYRLGGAVQNENKILIGNQDNGTDLYNPGNWANIWYGDGMECAIDPVDADVMYVENEFAQIYRFTNDEYETPTHENIRAGYPEEGGKAAWVTPFIIDPIKNKTLYILTDRVYKSTNRGDKWSPISNILYPEVDDYRDPLSLAVAPSNSKYIYTAYGNKIIRTIDGGTSWSQFKVEPAKISYLVVHPGNPKILWVTNSGFEEGKKVYRSTDAGKSWQNITGNLENIPVNCIAVDIKPTNESIYIGTDIGVLYSKNDTGYWEYYGEGLPNVIVSELEIHAASRKIRAATYGRGLWEAPLKK